MQPKPHLPRPQERARQVAARLNRRTAIESCRFHYELDECSDAYRVWQVGTPGDVFDVIPLAGSEALLHFFRSHPDMFVEGMPEN